eukprot:Transcript_31111.p2 GENE.Transcript_31111~~Transcript_31111.p2  ORF type:complete len:99 (-),score=41.57 Transcript_31111:221-517(-)
MPPKPGGGIKRKDTLSTLMANEPDDLSQLLSLDEDSVRDALHARYDKQKIYTYINTLLVAMNPYSAYQRRVRVHRHEQRVDVGVDLLLVVARVERVAH